jgi:hypothetical protein
MSSQYNGNTVHINIQDVSYDECDPKVSDTSAWLSSWVSEWTTQTWVKTEWWCIDQCPLYTGIVLHHLDALCLHGYLAFPYNIRYPEPIGVGVKAKCAQTRPLLWAFWACLLLTANNWLSQFHQVSKYLYYSLYVNISFPYMLNVN